MPYLSLVTVAELSLLSVTTLIWLGQAYGSHYALHFIFELPSHRPSKFAAQEWKVKESSEYRGMFTVASAAKIFLLHKTRPGRPHKMYVGNLRKKTAVQCYFIFLILKYSMKATYWELCP